MMIKFCTSDNASCVVQPAEPSGSFHHVPKLWSGRVPSCLLAAILLLVGGLAYSAPHALALDPTRALTQYQRRSWGAESGLPSNYVFSVTQGSDGYLWLGMEESLVRFDGVRSQAFDRKDDSGVHNNTVYNVREDPRHPGEMILATASGVCRLAGGRIQTFTSTASPADLPGSLVCQDPADGASWFRTVRGLIRVDSDGHVTGPTEGTPGWPAEKIRTVCRDGAGRLWLGTTRGLYRQQGDGNDDGSRRFEPMPGWEGKIVDYLLPARGNGIWVGTRDAGIGRLAPDGAFHTHPALAGLLVETMLEDRSGMLWIGTSGNGIFRLPASEDPGAGPAPTSLTTQNGLLNNTVEDLCEDREGNVWIATPGGLQVLGDARFVNYGRPEGLAGDDVRSVLEDAHGRLWVGHENGLSLLIPGEDRVTNYALPASTNRQGRNRVHGMARGEDDDTVLVGTNVGLARWHEDKVEPFPLREDLDHSIALALCHDPAGDYWVGTDTGLYQVRDGRVLAHLTSSDGLASGVVHALLIDRRGNLWVGMGGGLSRRGPDGKITTFANSGPERLEGAVFSIFEDPTDAGGLFVGTDSGLHWLHAAADGGVSITRYTVREGLLDNFLWSILGDAQGNLWMSSNKGVSRLAIADLTRFDHREIPSIPLVAYGVSDGMRSREGNGGEQPAACKDHLGRFWFATVKGVVMVDPSRVAINAVPPPVHVEELWADGRVIPAGTPKAKENGGKLPLLELDPGKQKLDFHYTALSLLNPEANHFRYWLEGFDTGWTNAGKERTAHYTNLPPGFYRFHVQAANADGVWNLQGATMAFRLRPFWYQTGWFHALTAVMALVFLGLLQQGLRRRWQHRLASAEAKLREREHTAEILCRSKELAERAHEVAEQARQEAEAARGVAEAAHHEAEAARAEAERANEAKSEFLSRLSHELRTPLNAILGFGQLLTMEELAPTQAQGVEHIVNGGRRLLKLVDAVLDISRVASGETIMSMESVDLTPLLREVVSAINPLAREHGVSVQIDPGLRTGNLQVDRLRLKQVLLNLLTNAIKYNRPVGGEVIIEARSTDCPRPGELPRERILIRDNGSGIEPAGVAKLFNPFERHDAANGPVKGTGLGLAISKQLAEAMGGTIGVESIPGVGSTFWVEFAVSPATAEQVGSPTDSKMQLAEV